MALSVFGWNVYDENPKPAAEIAEFILSQNADIVCLQEVDSLLWKELHPLLSCVYGHHHTARDFHREGKEPSKLVFLSRLPMIHARAIKSRPKKGFRSFFTFFSNLFWGLKEEHIEFQRIDIKTDTGPLRVMNAHLEVGTGPQNRLNQFKHVLRKCKRRGRIENALIVGDFNIFGDEFLVRFAGFFSHGFGIQWLWLNERDEFRKICEKRGLKNIFEGQPTYARAGYLFQLDHILVPENIKVISQSVIVYACGSDHKAIIVELEI